MSNESTELQAALNGNREHPATPQTPDELAREARAAVDAGATSLHFHPYDDGSQTLEPEPCAEAVRAVRETCPETPISLTTWSGSESDPDRRLELIENWTELPDRATAIQSETGFLDLCDLLFDRGIAVEACLFSVDDAREFVDSGIASRCERVLVESINPDPGVAAETAEAMEQTLIDGGVDIQQIHHGYGEACWAVNRRAAERGHGIRTGLEDVTVLPDGDEASGNGDLITAAVSFRD